MDAEDIVARRARDEPYVALVRWPADEQERRRLCEVGAPRLLVVHPDDDPPQTWDELEDWVREPLDAEEVRARSRTLARRRLASEPLIVLNSSGVCRVGEQSVIVTPFEQAMLDVLVERVGEPVSRDEVQAAYVRAGGDGRGFRTALARLRRRLAPLGVQVHSLSSRALMLERATPCRPGSSLDEAIEQARVAGLVHRSDQHTKQA